MKKGIKFIGIFLCMFLGILGYNPAFADEKLYQGYQEVGGSNGDGLVIKDNGNHIAYCYDHDASPPSFSDDARPTWYTKVSSFLESNNSRTEKYGKDKKIK